MSHPKFALVWLVALAASLIAAPLVASAPVAAVGNGTLDTSHAYAGALIIYNPDVVFPFTGLNYAWCSGWLASSRIFVTAGHCADYIQSTPIPMEHLWVSFALNILADRSSWRSVASAFLQPDFSIFVDAKGITYLHSNGSDLGVVMLTQPESDITPGRFAPLGFLDSLAASGGLQHAKITMVGYGGESISPKGQILTTGDRRTTNVTFKGPLYLNWLGWTTITPSDGTLIIGDSGGPALLTLDGTEYVVAIHSNGVPSFFFDGPGYDFRMDTAISQNFVLALVASAG